MTRWISFSLLLVGLGAGVAVAQSDEGAAAARSREFAADRLEAATTVMPARPAVAAVKDLAGTPRPEIDSSQPNMTNHGGSVVQYAHAVPIFMNSYWCGGGGDSCATLPVHGAPPGGAALAHHVADFLAQLGTSPEYAAITQYYDTTMGFTRYVALNTLFTHLTGLNYWNLSAEGPKIKQADIENTLSDYFKNSGAKVDTTAVYLVFLPPDDYAALGSDAGGLHSCKTSNGSANFCAYHSAFVYKNKTVLYAVIPYPDCPSCMATSFTDAQNLELLCGHEMRDAVTDPLGGTWYDHSLLEAVDKCAWKTFVDDGFGYEKVWSNAAHDCVQGP